MITEVWKDVTDYEGYYQVSNLGRVKSLERELIKKNGIRYTLKERILRPAPMTSGYSFVTLYKETNSKMLSMHRLAAAAFIPNPENKPQVNHLNGNRKDNRVENLEWCTVSENLKYSFKYLGRKSESPSLGKFGKDNHLSKKVQQIDRFTDTPISDFNGVAEASRLTGVEKSNIAAVCRSNKFTRTAGGFKWKFV